MDSGVTLPACKISTKISEKRHYYKNKEEKEVYKKHKNIRASAYSQVYGRTTHPVFHKLKHTFITLSSVNFPS